MHFHCVQSTCFFQQKIISESCYVSLSIEYLEYLQTSLVGLVMAVCNYRVSLESGSQLPDNGLMTDVTLPVC